MAAPTEDEIQTQISECVRLADEADKFLRANSPNVGGMYDDFIAVVEGDFAPLAVRGADSFRAAAASMVSPSVVRAMLDPLWVEYAKQQGFPETDPLAIIDRIIVYFGEGSERVTSRQFTFGSASAGSNTGNGTINRLTEDRYGFDLETATAEVKTFKVIADRYSGSQIHQEVFEVRGANPPRDAVAGFASPDRVGSMRCLSADDSESIIANPSFNRYSGTAPDITAISDWTVTSAIGNFQIETTDTYRTAVHEGDAPGSVRFETNDTLTQKLSVSRPTLVRGVPYYCQIAFKRESSADGTLTLTVGGNSANVTLSAQSGWTILRLALDQNLFFEGFNETDIDVSIALASNTTGAVLVDDLVIGPMTFFDGTWWAPVGGATPFLVDDSFTTTDTETGAVLQEWFARTYRRALPSATGGSVTWAEPS